jgi:hypothetical protein
MKSREFIVENAAATALADRLPQLPDQKYKTIDRAMKVIARDHDISADELHRVFVAQYKATPDHWIKRKLKKNTKHKTAVKEEYTTSDIPKLVLSYPKNRNDSKIVRNLYKRIISEYHGPRHINSYITLINSLIPALTESHTTGEIKQFYENLKMLSDHSHVKIFMGAKLCLLQTIIDIYSKTVILKGFKNPKTIVDFEYYDEDIDKIKYIVFDDGTTFPEKYEYSTTDFGVDLLNTMFFNSAVDFEKSLTYIALCMPDGFSIGDKLISEDKDALQDDVLDSDNFEHNQLLQKFIDWSCERLHISQPPQFEWSTDTKDAQDNHHTGRHVRGSGVCWVYVKNRNLVDIMRTVFHELVHIRQDELGMIGDNASYPGSPIEAMADVLAGKYIKIFGEQHHEIFQ